MKQSKFILVMLLMSISLLSFSCKEEKPNYNYTNFQEETTGKQIKVKKVKNQKKTKAYSVDGELVEYSFWFVVGEKKGSTTRINSYMAQPHPGFSMKEYKEMHDDAFVLNLVEISYETYSIDSK